MFISCAYLNLDFSVFSLSTSNVILLVLIVGMFDRFGLDSVRQSLQNIPLSGLLLCRGSANFNKSTFSFSYGKLSRFLSLLISRPIFPSCISSVFYFLLLPSKTSVSLLRIKDMATGWEEDFLCGFVVGEKTAQLNGRYSEFVNVKVSSGQLETLFLLLFLFSSTFIPAFVTFHIISFILVSKICWWYRFYEGLLSLWGLISAVQTNLRHWTRFCFIVITLISLRLCALSYVLVHQFLLNTIVLLIYFLLSCHWVLSWVSKSSLTHFHRFSGSTFQGW